jgi:hypothetical protein
MFEVTEAGNGGVAQLGNHLGVPGASGAGRRGWRVCEDEAHLFDDIRAHVDIFLCLTGNGLELGADLELSRRNAVDAIVPCAVGHCVQRLAQDEDDLTDEWLDLIAEHEVTWPWRVEHHRVTVL